MKEHKRAVLSGYLQEKGCAGMGKISGKPGQQHLRFCKQNLKETGRIKGSGKTFSFHVGLGTEVGVLAEVQGGLVEEVQIQWRHIFLGSGEIFFKDNI